MSLTPEKAAKVNERLARVRGLTVIGQGTDGRIIHSSMEEHPIRGLVEVVRYFDPFHDRNDFAVVLQVLSEREDWEELLFKILDHLAMFDGAEKRLKNPVFVACRVFELLYKPEHHTELVLATYGVFGGDG